MLNNKRTLSYFLLGFIILNIFYTPLYANPPVPEVFAESAVLIDAKTGKILYGKNENRRLYPASITKLLTALIAIETQHPTDIITLSNEAVFSIERNSSHIGLDVGEEITLDQGLHALLLASANEVANGIAELCDGSIAAFGEHATRRAKELGANNTNFVNPHGLHDPNHYTTAYDMALISQEVLKQPYFRDIMNTHTYEIPFTNKRKEIRYLSQPHKLLHKKRYGKSYREDVIGGKTGYTTVAGNTLVTMAKRDDIELIVVVLKSDRQNLYKDTNLILDYGFDNYKSISLQKEDSIISSVPVYSVKSGQLLHVADVDVCVQERVDLLTMTNLKEGLIAPTITLPSRIDKDVTIGDVIGTIEYEYEGESLSINNLVVKSLNFLPSPEASVFPAKPMYAAPASIIPPIPWTGLGIGASAIVLILLGRLSFRSRRRSKLKRKQKKLLKFSKTIK